MKVLHNFIRLFSWRSTTFIQLMCLLNLEKIGYYEKQTKIFDAESCILMIYFFKEQYSLKSHKQILYFTVESGCI